MNRLILCAAMLILPVVLTACVGQPVEPPPISPVALEEFIVVVSPKEPVVGQVVTFQVTTGNGSLSFDPSIVFHWEFGDHAWKEGSRVDYTYKVASDYVVTLTTRYADGRTQVQQINLKVRSDAPGTPKTPVPPNEPTPTPAPTPPELPDNQCWNVVIDSVLPNPSGQEPNVEWIRVKNLCPVTMNLKGWYLADENGEWKFPAVNLDAEESIRIFGSDYNPDGDIGNIFLRNNGETVRLLNRDKILVDSCEYPDTNGAEDIVYLCE